MIQAMAFGIPVVSTDCNCGPAEILAGGAYGRLVPVGDAGEMAVVLGRALESPTSEEARRSVLERFSAGRVATEYLRLAGLPETIKKAAPERERTVVEGI